MRLYATFVVGEKDVVAYDEKLDVVPVARKIVVSRRMILPDEEFKEYRLAPLTVTIDGKVNDCIEFKKFQSKAEQQAWVGEKKQALAPKAQPPKPA